MRLRRIGQRRTSRRRTSWRRTSQGRTSPDQTSEDQTSQDRIGQEQAGQGKIRQRQAAKGAPAGRHRSPAGELQGADLTADHELESYLSALSPVRDPEITDPGRSFGAAKVYQLRLPPGAEEKVQWLAAQRGTAPLSLLQSWILQRLHREFSAPGSEPRE